MTKTPEPALPISLVASIIAPSPVAKQNRPWYEIKRVIGTIVGIVGGAMLATGGTIVVLTVPALGIPITVASIGWVVQAGGLALFGYGWGKNNQQIEDATK